MIWVEQPVHTGFSQGKLTIHNEDGVAKDFLGFFENFQKIFGIQNYKIYLSVGPNRTLLSMKPAIYIVPRASPMQDDMYPISELLCSTERIGHTLISRVSRS